MSSNLVLEVPPYGGQGLLLGDHDEVDGGARRVQQDRGDQALEVVRQLGLVAHLQRSCRGLSLLLKHKPLDHPLCQGCQLLAVPL